MRQVLHDLDVLRPNVTAADHVSGGVHRHLTSGVDPAHRTVHRDDLSEDWRAIVLGDEEARRMNALNSHDNSF
jgi:hypothetical protein